MHVVQTNVPQPAKHAHKPHRMLQYHSSHTDHSKDIRVPASPQQKFCHFTKLDHMSTQLRSVSELLTVQQIWTHMHYHLAAAAYLPAQPPWDISLPMLAPLHSSRFVVHLLQSWLILVQLPAERAQQDDITVFVQSEETHHDAEFIHVMICTELEQVMLSAWSRFSAKSRFFARHVCNNTAASPAIS